MTSLRPDEDDALGTYNRLRASITVAPRSAGLLTVGLIIARAIKMANYKPNVVGYREDDD